MQLARQQRLAPPHCASQVLQENEIHKSKARKKLKESPPKAKKA
jgi:hypothetical protein